MSLEDKELIWVPKSLAEQYKASENSGEQILLDYYDKLRQEAAQSIKQMDDDLVEFKARAVAYREELSAVYAAQEQEWLQAWQESDEAHYKLYSHIRSRMEELRTILEEVRGMAKDVDTTLERLPRYQLVELTETLERLEAVASKLAPSVRNALKALVIE